MMDKIVNDVLVSVITAICIIALSAVFVSGVLSWLE